MTEPDRRPKKINQSIMQAHWFNFCSCSICSDTRPPSANITKERMHGSKCLQPRRATLKATNSHDFRCHHVNMHSAFYLSGFSPMNKFCAPTIKNIQRKGPRKTGPAATQQLGPRPFPWRRATRRRVSDAVDVTGDGPREQPDGDGSGLAGGEALRVHGAEWAAMWPG